ncbi:MAG TPA: DoxX family protein [Gemmatimonadaceae bacterium]
MRSLLPPPSHAAGLLVLRVGLAIIVLFHGIFKLRSGVAWMAGPLGEVGLPAFLAYGVYLAEVVAPILLVIGLWARLAALVICIDMIMAVVLVLRDQVFATKEAGGGWAIELEALIFFAALTIAIAGAGRYALMRDTRRHVPVT